MAIKDLLVAFDANAASQNAARFAVQMAKKYNASITGTHVFRAETYESHIQRWIPKDVQETMRQSEEKAEKEIEASFRQLAADLGFTGGLNWIAAQGRPSIVLPQLSRYFDILVLGQFTKVFQRDLSSVQPDELLTRSGTPIIVIPVDYRVRAFTETAAVAWDGSRSAARAMRDAMQILETKSRLDVLCVGKDAEDSCVAANSQHDIIEHLKSHGINATKHVLSTRDKSPAEAILDHCKQTDPDILVLGAFGRGKFGAALFGSVARHVIKNMTVPLFISH